MSSNNHSQKDVFSDYGLNTQSQRDRLMGRGKILVYLGWMLTGLSALAIIVLLITYEDFSWGLFGLLFGILILAQGIRIIGRMMKKKSEQIIPFSEKKIKLVKKQRDNEVRQYFDKNPAIASKVIQMKELAKIGKYKDAYNIATSILKTNIPAPIRDFLTARRNQYAKLRKSK